jgi:diguanylate cyclase (GGDEF)-like protein
MELIDQVKERLSVFKNLYDAIRIVDPVNKNTTNVTDNEIQGLYGTCYGVWKRNKICQNCISMRAYVNNDTFTKIEYDKEKIISITATPMEIEGRLFIVEILKDITRNGTVLHKLTEGSKSVEELMSSMNEKVVKDDLTGLYNRRYITERLPVDINYSRISSFPLSVIMVDIDFFKKVNDKYGHIIGDKILVDFSQLILNLIRSNSDWVGRYGGEEFIIILNDTNLENAYNVAEKIRKQLENTTFRYDEININITASFGVENVTDYDISITDLLSKVDKSLYKAKAGGRNITITGKENANQINIKDINNRSEKNIKISELNKQINEIRDILNEVCCTIDGSETKRDVLTISQYLDELIVEYMKELNDVE